MMFDLFIFYFIFLYISYIFCLFFSVLKYQHWIELLNALYGLQLNNFPARIPDKNVVLGGRLSLSGNFASLACFHGTNFRTQNWGLFTVREPALQFTSETRVVEKSCQVMRAACVHDVTFSLGKSEDRKMSERRKSTVNMYGKVLFSYSVHVQG